MSRKQHTPKAFVLRLAPGATCRREPVRGDTRFFVRAPNADRTELGRGRTAVNAWASALQKLRRERSLSGTKL